MNHIGTLVLVPGTLCDETIFNEMIALLGGDVDVVVADVTHSNSVEALAQDVLAQAPPAFALAGLSLGGIIAAEVARLAPERLHGLALFDTNLSAADPAQVDQRRRWERDVRAGHFARIVADDLVEPLTARPGDLGSTIFDMAIRIGPAAFLRQNAAAKNRPDLRWVVDRIEVPVLVAHGALDNVCPTALHLDLVKRCVNAEYACIPDAGHLATLDQPHEAAHALRGWLQTCNNTKHLQEGNTNEYNVA